MAGFRVLLVDDETEFLEPTAERLKRRQIACTAVTSGEAALAALENAPFDCAIVDVKMPGMDGLTLLRRLRQDHPWLAVVLLTGHASIELGVRGLELGAFEYLMKPVDLDELLDTARRAAAQKQREQQAPPPPQPALAIDPPYRVLLVDDEVDYTSSLAQWLTRRGFVVAVAAGGEQALAVASVAAPDAVLLDIHMPGIDGVRAMQMLHQAHPTLAVILLTGHESVRSGIDGMVRGAFDYLTKPIDLDVLFDKLCAACAQKRAQDDAASTN